VPTPELELQLSLLARRLSKPVRLPGESGFTVLDRPAYQALWRIVEEGPMRSTALAKLIGIDLSVVSRQVKFLEEVGFVRRQPDPLDARAALVSATESGQSALELSRSKRTEVLDEVLEDWSQQDRDELVRLLGRFNSELEIAIERRMAADPG
jgi:DNA-binding MarR family transcriptional regulator